MRHDGCNGGVLKGPWLFNYADDRFAYGRLRFSNHLDLHSLCCQPNAGNAVSFLSYLMAFNNERTCNLLYCGKEAAGSQNGRANVTGIKKKVSLFRLEKKDLFYMR